MTTPVALIAAFDHAALAAQWQVAGLSDEEYSWEPLRPCWSVRRRVDTDWPHIWGHGEFVVEDVGPGPGSEPPRVTTIAWRLVHLAAWLDVYRIWIAGRTDELPLDDFAVPGDAATAVAWLGRAQGAFRAEIDPLPAAGFRRTLTTYFGESRTVANMVHGLTLEAYHHSAEIGCLRDLHRGHARSDWWPEDIPPREG